MKWIKWTRRNDPPIGTDALICRGKENDERIKMKFKQLHIGQKFDFDHSTLSWPLNIEPGPWVKISARKYTKATSPFSLDYHERNEHALWSQLNCQVGTINVLVVPA